MLLAAREAGRVVVCLFLLGLPAGAAEGDARGLDESGVGLIDGLCVLLRLGPGAGLWIRRANHGRLL